MFPWLKKIKDYFSRTEEVVEKNKEKIIDATSNLKSVVNTVDSFLGSFRTKETLGEKISSLSNFIDDVVSPTNSFLESLVEIVNQKPAPTILASALLANEVFDCYIGEKIGEKTQRDKVTNSYLDKKILENYTKNYSGVFRNDANAFGTNIQKTRNSNYLQRLVNIILGDSKIEKEGGSRRAWAWKDREKLLDNLVDEAPANLSNGYEQIGILKKIVENNSYLKKTNLNAYKRVTNLLSHLQFKYKN